MRSAVVTTTGHDAPRVTIGVPVYNGGRYLERALDSLMAQTFQDLEIVVSDNASTDDTLDIVRRAAARDPRVRYSVNSENRGLVWNHRRVLALARGTYFMFAPHDDWFAPQYVERAVEVLDHNPEVTWAYAETILVDEEGRELGREIARQRLADPSPSTRFWDVLVVQGGINWYGMTRRELLGRIGRYRPLPRGERIVLAELALHGPFRLLPGDLYFRRVHDGQLTARRTDRKAEAAVLDPRRTDRIRSSVPAMLAEYSLAYVEAAVRAPIPARERARAIARVARWAVGKIPPLAIDDPRARQLDIRMSGTQELPAGRDAVGY